MQVDFPQKKKDNKERISGQYKMCSIWWLIFEEYFKGNG